MADKAHKWTDKEIEKTEKKLLKIYKEAEKDLREKLQKALDTINEAPNIYKRYKTLKAEGKTKEANEALKLYKKTMADAVGKKEFYTDHLKAISNDITHLNERAIAYVNGQLPDVLKYNYNFVGGEASKYIQGYSFHLADERTLKAMYKKLPEKKVKIVKDVAYNNKQINAQLIQGIIQGEDIPKIAKRMQNVMNTEWKESVRNARTLMTSAETLGRQEGYEQLEADGVIMKKVWIATPDEKTRESHLALDGEEVDVNEPFITINGEELMRPGDPDGSPAEVYNCRCTMEARVKGFRHDDGTVKMINYQRSETRHEKQIKEEKRSRKEGNKNG